MAAPHHIDNRSKPRIALLIAAHNEEVVIGNTLRSAIAAGMKPEHIYVVDDNSSDATSEVARAILPFQNVCRVRRSGKGLALSKAIRNFKLTSRYRWVHLADADGAFAPNYFRVFRRRLRLKYAAATGYIRSLPGRHISQYRVFEYTVGMELHRRFQSLFNVIPIVPGPSSCFRADILRKLNFANNTLTEDFDVTMQIYRQKLGRIQFIPQAVAYTQDPKTNRDFTRQISRWNRGILQGMKLHKVGRRVAAIDLYLSFQILQNFLFFINYLIWIPYIAISRSAPVIVAMTFLCDVALTFFITFLVVLRSRRWDILSAFPYVYAFRWLSSAVFLKAFVEVVILRRFKSTQGIWANNAKRRYLVRTS